MSLAETKTTAWLPQLSRSVWIAALVIAAAFFLSEHNVRLSQAIDFTEDQDQMLATAEGGNFFRRIAFFSLAALGVGFFVTQAGFSFRPTLLAGLITASIALAFTSILWAQDPSLCLRRLLVLALALIGAIGIARRLSLEELCHAAFYASLACVLIGVLCEVTLGTFRPWSGEYRFSGTVHPNTQGAYLATVCFSALCLSMTDAPRRKQYWSVLAVAVILLVLTKSRTSTAGVMVVLGLVTMILSSPKTRLLVPALCIWLGLSGLLVLLLSGANADVILAKIAFLGREEGTESFSGRTTIWPVVQQFIDRRFWLGYGFESFWTPAVIEEVTRDCEWPVREAHSTYREQLLSLGFVGLMLLGSVAVVGLVAALLDFHRRRDPSALFWFALVLNGLFNGMFESGMAMISLPTFVIALGLIRLAYFHRCAPVRYKCEPWQPRSDKLVPWGAAT